MSNVELLNRNEICFARDGRRVIAAYSDRRAAVSDASLPTDAVIEVGARHLSPKYGHALGVVSFDSAGELICHGVFNTPHSATAFARAVNGEIRFIVLDWVDGDATAAPVYDLYAIDPTPPM